MKNKIRGYDTPQLYRRDTLVRMERLDTEIAEVQRNIKCLEHYDAGTDEDDDPNCE